MGLNFLPAQISENLRKVDSIHKNILNKKISDSIYLAKVNYTIGELYRYSDISDSAYYYYHKSEKFYKDSKYKFEYAKVLYGIAVIQANEKDYTGSEATSFEAISILESLGDSDMINQRKSFVYNSLGNVFDELGQFDESIRYYKNSIELKNSLKGDFKFSIDNSINNMAKAYSNSGNYALALKYYNQLLENKKAKNERPDFYAMVLGNYAYNLYLSKKTKQLPDLFFKALKITDSVSPNGYNSIIINQHIAEYYHDSGNSSLAKFYAYKAKSISEKYGNDDLLKSLLLLSKIEKGDKAFKHLNAYVKLNDSLYRNERSIRNKFERIRFETNQIEKENVKIAKERMWLLIISVVLIIASLLLYIIINQRTKNKELQFIQKQQETNEEIYNLMLSEQDNIEEARVIEKKRISEELHDGVLGRLFGTRLSLDSLNMATSEDAINTRSQYISELKTIEEDIRKVSHELNTDFVSGSGFIDIINNLVETQTLAYQLKYKLNQDGAINWDGVSNKNKIHIYRIIQEALHNIHKHAEATIVTISFKLKKSLICLNIVDDGSGFDVNKAKSGIGLKNINSRTAEINGIIKIKSEINEGTTVTIEIPIT
ncbi:MAG: tetratricopeptide repeat protein [Algibacter sp.]